MLMFFYRRHIARWPIPTEVPTVPPTQIYLSWFIAVGYWMLKSMFSTFNGVACMFLGIALWREKMLPPNPLGYKLVEAV